MSYNENMVKKSAEVIIFDVLGVLSILVGLLLSPFPGPWTIPLYILGLSLLGKNHHWARRIFTWLNEKGGRLLPPSISKYIVPITIVFFVVSSLITAAIYYFYLK